MLFGPGLLIAGGTTLVFALLDRACEKFGFFWIGTFVKLLLPLIGFVLAIYFLESNSLLRWLK